jgi:hypothetical protein
MPRLKDCSMTRPPSIDEKESRVPATLGTYSSLPITISRIYCLMLFSDTRHQPILNIYCFSTTLTAIGSILLEVDSAENVDVEYERHLSYIFFFEYNLLFLEVQS